MAEKDMTVSSMADATAKISDLQVIGDPGAWVLACKASSQDQGWMKSTKRLSVPGGAIFQMETQQRNPDGGYSLSQSAVFVPDFADFDR